MGWMGWRNLYKITPEALRWSVWHFSGFFYCIHLIHQVQCILIDINSIVNVSQPGLTLLHVQSLVWTDENDWLYDQTAYCTCVYIFKVRTLGIHFKTDEKDKHMWLNLDHNCSLTEGQCFLINESSGSFLSCCSPANINLSSAWCLIGSAEITTQDLQSGRHMFH